MIGRLIVLLVIQCCQVLPSAASSNSLGMVLGKLMDKFYTDSTKVITIQISSDSAVDDRIQSDLVNEALTSRKTLVPVVCGQVQQMDLKYLFYYNVFLVTSFRSFLQLYKTINPWIYDYTGRFIIVYMESLQQKDETVDLMLADMWRKRILNAIVIVTGESSVKVYSYFPYRPGECGKPNTFLIADISYGDNDLNLNLFKNHLSNMHGCVVKVGSFSLNPITIIEKNSNGQTTYKGTETDVVKTVAEVHNFTLEFHLPENGAKWGFIRETNSTGLMELIQSETVDLGYGSVGLTFDRNYYLKAGIPHSTSTFVFVVPPGRLYTSFEKLHKPFTREAWAFLAAAITVGMLTAKLFFSSRNPHCLSIFTIESMEFPLLNMWTQLLGLPLPRLPRKNITLAMVVGWMLTGLIVRTIYQGAMFKYLHSGMQIKSVQTVEDFQAAGLYYYMYDVSQRFFVTSPYILNRTKQILENEDTDIIFQRLLRGDLDGVLVLPAAMVSYFNQQNAGRGHLNTGTDIVTTYISCIYYPKSSHLPEIFDAVILNLHAFGFLSYWREQYGDVLYDEIITNRDLESLKLDSVSGIFVIWLISLVICTVVFCFEVVVGKCPRFRNY